MGKLSVLAEMLSEKPPRLFPLASIDWLGEVLIMIMAEKIVLEVSDGNIEKLKSVYNVLDGETVESLLKRMGMTGSSSWHYDMMEVRLKIVIPSNT